MKISTAKWPGLPGPGGPDRSGGAPKTGSMGDFYVFSQFSPPKLGTGERFHKGMEKIMATGMSGKSAAAIMASAGRKKYGKKKFQKLAAQGKPGY